MEKEVEKIIKELGSDNKIKFSVFCIERIIDLYKNVDDNEDISIIDSSLKKGEAYKSLKMIFDEVKNKSNMDENRLNELLDICDPLILDIEEVFDNTIENVVASIVAQSVDYLIRFYLEKDESYICYCSSNNIEILNQIKSDEYSRKINTNANSNEINKYLCSYFNSEYNIQIKALNLILNGKFELLNDLIMNNKIFFTDN